MQIDNVMHYLNILAMKPVSKFLYSAILLFVLTGCAANKPASAPDPKSVDGDVASAALHQQALRALDARKFIIEGAEFYLLKGKSPVKSSSGSSISMNGNRAAIRLSPELYAHVYWDDLDIKDDAAEITLLKRKRNGDLQYRLVITGSQYGQEREVIVTLYKGTNKCFVRIDSGRSGATTNILNFTGHIYPVEE